MNTTVHFSFTLNFFKVERRRTLHAIGYCIQKRPEKKDFIEHDVSPSRASSANREQGGEGRSYIPVSRQRDIGASVPGTVKQVRGK